MKLSSSFLWTAIIEMSVRNLLFHGSGDNLQMNFLGVSLIKWWINSSFHSFCSKKLCMLVFVRLIELFFCNLIFCSVFLPKLFLGEMPLGLWISIFLFLEVNHSSFSSVKAKRRHHQLFTLNAIYQREQSGQF